MEREPEQNVVDEMIGLDTTFNLPEGFGFLNEMDLDLEVEPSSIRLGEWEDPIDTLLFGEEEVGAVVPADPTEEKEEDIEAVEAEEERPSRRKSPVASRNIVDEAMEMAEGSPVAQRPQLQLKPRRRPTPKKSAGKAKVWTLDPEKNPEAKGARYSRMNRLKKKLELKHSQENLVLALNRIRERDAILRQLLHLHPKGMFHFANFVFDRETVDQK